MTGTENIQKNLSEKIWSQTCKKRQKKSQGMMERHRREPLVQGATGSRALSHLPLDLLRRPRTGRGGQGEGAANHACPNSADSHDRKYSK
jgi:hypothetical protein